MKKTNKLLVLSFSFIFAFGMTACGNETSESNSNSDVEKPSSTPEVTPSETPSTPSIDTSSTPSTQPSTDDSSAVHTHNLTKVDSVSATCTTNGNVEYYTCDGCEELFTDASATTTTTASAVVVAKTGHNLTAVAEVSATCTTNGVKAYWTCSGCETLFADPMGMTTTNHEQLVIPAGHNIEHHEAVAPTCTTAGNVEYWHCAGCETYYSDANGTTSTTADAIVVEALGHAMTHHESNAATCTTDGNVEYWTCGTCDKYYADANGTTETNATAVVVAKTGHTLTHVAGQAATCTTDGVREHYFCDACDTYFKDANGQTETTQASTVIPASGHTMTHHEGHAATCEEDGSKEYWTCSGCNTMYLDEAGTTPTTLTGIYVAPKGHNLTHVEASTPTCEEYGYNEHYDCADCDKYFLDAEGTVPTTIEEVRINKAHNMTHHDAVAKTCTTAGSKEYWQCGTCEAIFLEAAGDTAVSEADLVVPASHNLVAHEANAATCTVNGNVAYWTCADCNKYYLDANGENETTANDVVIVASHNMDHHDAAAATCTDAGNIEYWYCEKCDGYYLDANGTTVSSLVEVTIPATGHSEDTALNITQVVDGVATVVRSCANGCNDTNITYEVVAPTIYANSINNEEQLANVFTVNTAYDYTFTFVADGMLRNNNSETKSTNAYLELTALNAGTFSFDVAVFSEAGCDIFYIYKNGTKVFESNKNMPGISNTAEGKASLSFEMAAGDKIKFDKKTDGSGWYGPDGDKDYAKITNMKFVSSVVPEGATYSVVDFEANGGNEVTPMVAFTNNTLETLPEATRTGYYFLGWYVDETLETPFTTSTVITENTKVYAKWYDATLAIPCFGDYVGYETWGSSAVSGSKYTLSIDVLGNTSGYVNGTITYDSENNSYSIVDSSKAIAYDPSGIIVVFHSSTDIYVFVKTSSDITMKAVSFKDEETNYTIKLIEYTVDGYSSAILVKDGKIYSGVTYSSIFTSISSVADIKNISDIVVKDVDGNVLVSVGYNGSDYVALDDVYGIYTNGEETLKVSGLGTIDYNGEKGTYTVENNVCAAYIGGSYYEFTLVGETFDVVKPMVKVTYVTGEGHNPIPSSNFNKNIAAELPVLEEANYVFNGWYFDVDFTTAVPAEWAPVENITLYAKWSAPAILTANPNNGNETLEVVYSVGDTTDIDNPIWKGHIFIGWYTTATFDEGSEWANGEITENITIYAKWEDAPIYNQTYGNMQLNGTNADGGVTNLYSYSSAYISVDELGKATGAAYPFRGNVSFDNYNKETGYVEITVGSSVYIAYIDGTTGIAIMNQSSGLTSSMSKVYVLSPFEQSPKIANFTSSYWNGGMDRVAAYTYNEVTYVIYVHNNVAYFNVNVTDLNGAPIADLKTAYNNATGVRVTNNSGTVIAEFGFDGTKLCELDGHQGTYTNGEDTLVLDGVATATFNGVEGTYSVASDSEYTLNLYVANTYYEVTLNENTFTMNKPMVEITYNYNYEGSTDNTVSVNKNIGMTLEVPTREGYVFKGWMSTADGTASDVSAEIAPEANVTYYALWAEKLVVTINYGNGLGTATEAVAAGEVPTLKLETTFKDGYAFEGWYTTANREEGTKYEFTPVVENMTVYANWIAAVAQYGSYKGTEIWGSTKTGGTFSGGSSKTLNVDSLGVVSGDRSGQISEYDETTGLLKVGTRFSYYDAVNGILIISDPTNTTALDDDLWIFFKNATVVTVDKENSCYWNSGLSEIVKFIIDGKEVYMFFDENNVYYNVTFVTTPKTEGGTVANNAIYSQASSITIYDANGAQVGYFKYTADNGLAKADGYQGTYTVGTDTIVLDGYGVATINDVTGTYSVRNNRFNITAGSTTIICDYNNETKTFTTVETDSLASKKFNGSVSCDNGYYGDEDTITFTFDGVGGVNITCACGANGYYTCNPSYLTSKMTTTYTFVDGVVTVVAQGSYSSYTFTFTVDNSENPTTLTCSSTNYSGYEGYFATGTVFAKA